MAGAGLARPGFLRPDSKLVAMGWGWKVLVLVLVLALVLHCALLSAAGAAVPASEAAALRRLKASLRIGNGSWPWGEAREACGAWAGVVCGGGHVVGIGLAGLNLGGDGGRPALDEDALRRLKFLGRLNASGFRLAGEVPRWLGNVNSLEELDFTSSELEGRIPGELGGLKGLAILAMGGNRLSGGIPASFGNLSSLVSLNLSGNLLTGRIPRTLRNLPRLLVLDVSGNNLSGPIPGYAVERPLQQLLLRNNSLTGAIPQSIGRLASLRILDVGLNGLSGGIPWEIGGLGNLRTLNVEGNLLNESFPGNISGLQSLVVLEASRNGLSGMLPEGVGDLKQLERLRVAHNLLLGPLPEGLAGLEKLKVLDVSDNFFEGPLPVGLVSSAEVGGNCFSNGTGGQQQQEVASCAEFYSRQGLQFGGAEPSASPASGPSVGPVPILMEGVGGSREGSHAQYKLIAAALLGGVGGLLLVLLVGWVALCVLTRAGTGGGAGVGPGYSYDCSDVADAGRAAPAAVDLAHRLGEAFAYAILEQATRKFHAGNLIVAGHSGDLYRGLLDGHLDVVVKRIETSRVRRGSFAAELDVMYRTSHIRIVSLLGHCLDKEDVKFLVYRYMPNGDLASSLHKKKLVNLSPGGAEVANSLDWITRLKIAIGVAEGLTYLHHQCNPPLVHRDVTSSSILLDDKYEVRIGSLSEVHSQDGDSHHPSIISRLLGLSFNPEQVEQGGFVPAASTSQDVYNFGKVLLELVSGQIGISSSTDSRADAWLEWALPLVDIHDKELLPRLVDPTLMVDEDLLEEVWAVAILAKLCLNVRPNKRPSMRHVLRALENPHKVIREDNFRETLSLRTSSHSSWNEALFGSWRSNFSSQRFGPLPGSLREEYSLKNGIAGIQLATGPVPHSRRASSEIVPEPYKDRSFQLVPGEPELVH